jgi:hypothetical protein
MTFALVSIILALYFGVLIGISINTFFTANRQSNGYRTAFGMISPSLLYITFIAVPDNVGKINVGYFQVVPVNLLRCLVMIGVLMLFYCRLNLVSIYTYLKKRFDFWSHKTAAFFLLIYRTICSAHDLFYNIPAAVGK